MSKPYVHDLDLDSTPQTKPIPFREKEMIRNSAGGFTFEITDWQKLERFLLIGTEGGTYYVGQKPMTLEHAKTVVKLLEVDGPRVVEVLKDISHQGRAHKNDAAIFVLALALKFGDLDTQRAAEAAAPVVCRIGTHWFALAENLKGLNRGWGRRIARLFARHYSTRPLESLAYDVAKYQQREGWSQADLLRLSHPQINPEDAQRHALVRWVLGTDMSERTVKKPNRTAAEYPAIDAELPLLTQAFEKVKRATTVEEVIAAMQGVNLPWECVPSQWHKDPKIWKHLLHSGALPMGALLRKLGQLSELGVLTNFGEEEKLVYKLLTDPVALSRSRLHPMAILFAWKTYASGGGLRSDKKWPVLPRIVEALETGFERSFANVQPTNKSFFVGVDVSGSMISPIANSNVTCCVAAAALLKMLMSSEPFVFPMAFTHSPSQLPVTRNSSLQQVVKECTSRNFGDTDCALPMVYALEHNIRAEVFVVITDNETWFGPSEHPSQALQRYRKDTGIPAKLIVLAMTASRNTIADPTDAGMLDIVGFDTSTPQVIAEFAKS